MSSSRPSHETRRDAVEDLTQRQIEHDRSMGKPVDERATRKDVEKMAENHDRDKKWD